MTYFYFKNVKFACFEKKLLNICRCWVFDIIYDISQDGIFDIDARNLKCRVCMFLKLKFS